MVFYMVFKKSTYCSKDSKQLMKRDSEKEKLDFWWQHTIVNVNIKL